MEKIIEKYVHTSDMSLMGNGLAIASEYVPEENRLEMLKALKHEFRDEHHDEDTARIILRNIHMTDTMDAAHEYYVCAEPFEINLYDWYVLWGEMTRRVINEATSKEQKKPAKLEVEKRTLLRCIDFLSRDLTPYHDLGL